MTIRKVAAAQLGPASRDKTGLFNSAALLDGTGQELGRYRKMHIPGTVDVDPSKPFQVLEKRYFKPGGLGFPAYDSPVGPVGMAICYDRRFPETFRCLGLSGAEIYAVVFNTPYNQAEDNARARSIEAHELAVRCAACYTASLPSRRERPAWRVVCRSSAPAASSPTPGTCSPGRPPTATTWWRRRSTSQRPRRCGPAWTWRPIVVATSTPRSPRTTPPSRR